MSDPQIAALAQANARWQLRVTLLTTLPIGRLRRRLGVLVDEASLAALAALSFDPAVGWRNRNGRNHVTPVKDQGGCGPCVSFCTVVVEAMASIEHGQTLDRSEADLHFCSPHGANCNG